MSDKLRQFLEALRLINLDEWQRFILEKAAEYKERTMPDFYACMGVGHQPTKPITTDPPNVGSSVQPAFKPLGQNRKVDGMKISGIWIDELADHKRGDD